MIFKKFIKGMGGVMDLVYGVKKVIVIMEYCNKYGEFKVKKECFLFLIGKGVVY